MKLQDVLLRGDRASQPTADATNNGFLYYVTDEGLLERSNGSTWQSYSTTPSLVGTATGIDLNTASATTIYTVPIGRTFVVTNIVLRNASTSLTTVHVSVGYTGPTYDDVVQDYSISGMTDNTFATDFAYALFTVKVGSSGAALKLIPNVVQGAAATIDADVFGYFI